ncbi:MAG: hypothetical protein Q7R47_01505 [Candidatus Diapherotrites archaeon]|nr:hypothetical protein [Candidatus Diapherotrites archaeon]
MKIVGIEGLDAKSLQKTVLVFGLDDVVVAGRVHSTVDSTQVKKVLENLGKLAKKFPFFHFFVVSGYQKEITLQKLGLAGLTSFFPEQNIRFVSQEYLDSKESMDREIYDSELAKDPLFKDEYFKQKEIEKIATELGVPMEKIVFVGHDLFFDAYYSQRFSKVDFVLVKESLSNQHKRVDRIIKGLNYIHLDWNDLRDVLLGKFPPADCMQLRNFIHFYLQRHLVSHETMGTLVEARIKQLEQRKAGTPDETRSDAK